MLLDLKYIEEARKSLGLSQQGAAEAAGWKDANARVRWFDIESGKTADPRLSTVMKIADVLGSTVDELLLRNAGGRRRKRDRKVGRPSGRR